MGRVAADYVYDLSSTEPIVNGFVEYNDKGVIERLGVSEDINNEKEFYKGAITPAFVNSHCHIELSYLHRLFRKRSGMAGFIDQINLRKHISSASELEQKEELSRWMKILWQRGVGAMADISNTPISFAIKKRSPMYTRTFIEVFGTEAEAEAANSVIESAKEMKIKANGMGLDATISPHSCYTMSAELLYRAVKEGLGDGFVSYHCQESPEEEEMLRWRRGPLYENRKEMHMTIPDGRQFPSSLVYFIDKLLKVHPIPYDENILLVHECCMSSKDADELKRLIPNAYIALCPLSNIYIHNLLPPISGMKKKGLKLTIGTDSLASNDDLDMVKEMLCIQKKFNDISLGELLTWACKNGAEYLRKDNIFGTIEPGKHPGLVHIDNLDERGNLTVESVSKRIV